MWNLTTWSCRSALASIGLCLSLGAAAQGDMEKESFLNEASKDNVAEVNLGKMAQERSQNPDVTEFAALIIEDHQKAQDQAKQIADGDLPKEMTPEHKQVTESLSDLRGKEFDRQYIEAMIEEHQKAIAKFEQQAESDDSESASFARQQLPVLRKHLEMAQAIHDDL